jgi:phosphatidylglycerophosphate synthase
MPKIPSIRELKKSSSKKSTNGFLNPMCDFLAFYPAKLFLYLPLNPVQITVLWILIKIAMALLILKGGYVLTIIALTIFQLASILDGVDGIVCRFRKDYSYNGIYIDYIGHYMCNSLLLICLGLGNYFITKNVFILIASAIGAFSFLLAKSITINLEWFKTTEQRKEIEEIVYSKGFSLKSQKKGFLALASDFLLIDNPFNLMFWGFLIGLPSITLWVYAIALTLELFRRMFIQYNRIHKAEIKNKYNMLYK